MAMKRWIVLLAFVVANVGFALAQDYKNYDDVIYGTDGSVVRGVIIEQVPGVSYKIATKDGNIFVYDALKVEKITKEPPVRGNYQEDGDRHRYDEYGRVVYKKSPLWSAVGSFCITGLGQVLNGETRKGLLLFGGHAACVATCAVAATFVNEGYGGDPELNAGVAVVSLLGAIGIRLYSIIEAPIYASRYNEQNGFALGDNKWLKVGPNVQVYNTFAMGTSTSVGLGATLTF